MEENTIPEVSPAEGAVGFKETKILSFGELLVGNEFDPENEDRVVRVKNLMAEVANIMMEEYNEGGKSPLKSLLFDHAIGEIANAQMAAVKVITFKK
jgi:hypothetical protein